MVTGLSLAQLAESIIQQNREKRDFIVPVGKASFAMVATGDEGRGLLCPTLTFGSDGKTIEAAMTEHAFRQITEYAGIPVKNGEDSDL